LAIIQTIRWKELNQSAKKTNRRFATLCNLQAIDWPFFCHSTICLRTLLEALFDSNTYYSVAKMGVEKPGVPLKEEKERVNSNCHSFDNKCSSHTLVKECSTFEKPTTHALWISSSSTCQLEFICTELF
jgi:hypothetical protein